MKTFRKIIFLLAFATMFTGLFSACGKKDKQSQEGEKEGRNRTASEEKLPELPELPDSDSVNVKAFRHGTMPVETDVPEAALITETEDSLTAETAGYLFYVFGIDRYRGAILSDAMDVLGLVNADATDEAAGYEARDIIRLRDFTLSKNESGTIFSNPDGFLCPMSSMEFESQSGRKSSGEGFLMVTEMNKGYGLYVILGIVKDGKTNGHILNMLQSCAMSLKQDPEGMGEFEEWTGSLPDGTDIKAVFKKNTVLNTDEDTSGIYLYYDEEDTGFFLIQHYNVTGKGTSEEYMRKLLDNLKKQEGVTGTDVETVEGSMTYSKGTVTYESDGVKMQEAIHVCVDNNEVWIVDLVGTMEQAELQKENLSLLLESLRKD